MNQILAFILFVIVALAPSAYAAEQMPVVAPAADIKPPFSVVVTSDGGLTAKAGDVFTQGGNYSGMTLPYLVSEPAPIQYPRWAIDHSWEGQFEIAIEVLLDGSVGRYKVMKSTGHELLDKTATKAVKSWKFHPAVKDGKAIVTCIEIPVIFKLQSE